MYCIYCGTHLEKELDICPYCGEVLFDALRDIDFSNREKLKQWCPDINTIVRAKFMGYEGSFSLQYSRVINMYKFFEGILYRNKENFMRNVVKIQDFSIHYVEAITQLAKKDLQKTALLAEVLFQEEGINVTYKKICGVYCNFLNSHFREIDEIIKEIEKQKAEGDVKRTDKYQEKMKNNYKTRWVGGGFGMAGALKGSIDATLMNAGASIGTGVASTVGYLSSVVFANIAEGKIKSDLFNSPEFRMELEGMYMQAMHEILLWNCKQIDEKLSISLFQGELYDCVGAHIKNTFKNVSSEQMIKGFFDNFLLNPYYPDLYVHIYESSENITSKDILELVSNVGNENELKYLFLISDENVIINCKSHIDDTEEDAKKKLQALQDLSKRNSVYTELEFAEFEVVCEYKNEYMRNWFQAVGRKKPVRWYKARGANTDYTIYRAYEQQVSVNNYDKNKREELLLKNDKLLGQIKAGDKLAICIWAVLNTQYSIAHKEPESKYKEIVWKLAVEGNTLAMSFIGEWIAQGKAGFSKNEYLAEMFFRMAALRGNPYAISYIGYYCKCGKAGYRKDESFAEDLFNLTMEVPLSKKRKPT